ncbi:MAG TPA: hypothetical protein VFO89_09770 [Thermoanaerobaculia bacterium]|nr:hypothetical protein [Thermoanaerobaculia bacterium]
MRIISGTVHDGRIVVEGNTQLTEGEKVTVLTREGTETFRVSPDQKRELLESIAQAKRGEFVAADELLRELDAAN